MMDGRVLVVDDEKLTRVTLEVMLQDEGIQVSTAASGFDALDLLGREDFDVVITDLRMPSMDGLDFQKRVREKRPDTAVIFMTAFGSVATAVEAMREGAADYLTKPLEGEELLIRIRRLIQRRRDVDEIRRLRAGAGVQRIAGAVVYRSTAMAAVVERALSVADTDATVLIEGETGTGKEVLARLIHTHSPRAAGPFIAVNCAGLNPNLVESELFGHEAGSFTGADRQRIGRLESASDGTLFIDEVDDLPPEIQVRLLRFLQDRTFERVGGNRTLRTQARVLCATKASLPERVRAGKFRDDLYYRINTVQITLPPLRSRREDILPLAEHFAKQFWSARGHPDDPPILEETMRALISYDWPGNVRELEHAMEHAITFARSSPIGLAHLPPHFQTVAPGGIVELRLDGLDEVSYANTLETCERKLIEWALARTGGNQARAAEMLQMSRTTFRGRLLALRQSRKTGDGDPGVPVTV